jgi:hypothetical protein
MITTPHSTAIATTKTHQPSPSCAPQHRHTIHTPARPPSMSHMLQNRAFAPSTVAAMRPSRRLAVRAAAQGREQQVIAGPPSSRGGGGGVGGTSTRASLRCRAVAHYRHTLLELPIVHSSSPIAEPGSAHCARHAGGAGCSQRQHGGRGGCLPRRSTRRLRGGGEWRAGAILAARCGGSRRQPQAAAHVCAPCAHGPCVCWCPATACQHYAGPLIVCPAPCNPTPCTPDARLVSCVACR